MLPVLPGSGGAAAAALAKGTCHLLPWLLVQLLLLCRDGGSEGASRASMRNSMQCAEELVKLVSGRAAGGAWCPVCPWRCLPALWQRRSLVGPAACGPLHFSYA